MYIMTTPLEIFKNSVKVKMEEQADLIGGDSWITDYEKFKKKMQPEIAIFIRECRRPRPRHILLGLGFGGTGGTGEAKDQLGPVLEGQG